MSGIAATMALDPKSHKSYTTREAATQTGFSTSTLENWARSSFFTPSLGSSSYSGADVEALQKLRSLPHRGRPGQWLRRIGDRLREWHSYTSNNEAFLLCQLEYDGYDVWELLPGGERRSCLRRPGLKRAAGLSQTAVPLAPDPTLQ